VVAPDKFKGTFTAAAVAAAIAGGLRAGGCAAVELPVADGGEGTARALLQARGGDWLTVEAADPLGRPVRAGFALLAGGETAVVDVAEAGGLWRLAPEEYDPWRATTHGTGQLIAAAAEAGAREVIVAAGGSATVDGGTGVLEALGGVGTLPRIVVAMRRDHAVGGGRLGVRAQKGASADTVVDLTKRLDALAAAAPPRSPRGPGHGRGRRAFRGAVGPSRR
jgi:glycerate kinase